jgi:hypothetical protein
MLMMLIYGGKRTDYKENTVTLVITSNDIGIEVNGVKTKYMVMSCDQNADEVTV